MALLQLGNSAPWGHQTAFYICKLIATAGKKAKKNIDLTLYDFILKSR
jgi:hypothetical protein